MGTIIELHQVPDEQAMLTRLLVYLRAFQKMMEPNQSVKN